LYINDWLRVEFLMENLKVEYRAVIKFLTKEGVSAPIIHERLVKVYQDQSPSYRTVTRWAGEFARGRESIEDDPHPGRPIEVTNEKFCNAVEKLVMEDRRIKVREIAGEIGISTGSVESILHEKLGLIKVCARWVPRMLSPVQRADRVAISRANLDLFNDNPEEFLFRVVTGDETWLHYYDPETKQQSMQWVHKNSPPPKKFRVQASAGKLMATVFWDAKGVIHIDYVPPKTTITGQYYAELLMRLRESMIEKRRGMMRHGVLLLHDNSPCHKANVAQAALRKAGFEELPHPPYSPDLAPSDFYLFRYLKPHLKGKRFGDDDEVKQETQHWLEEQSKDWYKAGIEKLKRRYEKCIELNGGYVEKE
jgi:histone-lysine N-methyltransferase SETMAR